MVTTQNQTAQNGGEYYIKPYYVDGICHSNETIYEFQGCMFHGCDSCYNSNIFNPITQCLHSTLKERTIKKLKYIKDKMPPAAFNRFYQKFKFYASNYLLGKFFSANYACIEKRN